MAFEEIPLGELMGEKGYIRGPFGSALKRAELKESGIPVYEQQHAIDGTRSFRYFVDQDKYLELRRFTVEANDLIISCSGTVGRISVIQADDPKGIISQALLILRPDVGKVLPLYLYYFLTSKVGAQELVNASQGAVQLNIAPRNIVERIPVPLPGDIDAQERIVNQLKGLDDKIDLNRRINQTLEAIAQAIFQSWFVDFNPVKAKIAAKAESRDPLRAAMSAISGKADAELDALPPEQYEQLAATAALFPDEMEASELGEIPKGWEASDFGSVSKCFDKHRIPLSGREREEKRGAIPYYGATSVMDYIDESIFDGVYLLLGEDGSVLKPDGTPFVQYIWGKSWVNNHAHVLQGANGISTEQLLLFISTQNISAYVTGAVQLKLNQKNMNSIPFIKAPHGINCKFAELIAPFFTQHRSLLEEMRSLTALRDILLPKLLSGELSVEAFTEPAGAA